MDIAYNFVYLALSAVFIASVWWGTLRLLDKSASISFREEFRVIGTSPIALAVYLGARILALAILFSPLLRVVL